MDPRIKSLCSNPAPQKTKQKKIPTHLGKQSKASEPIYLNAHYSTNKLKSLKNETVHFGGGKKQGCLETICDTEKSEPSTPKTKN